MLVGGPFLLGAGSEVAFLLNALTAHWSVQVQIGFFKFDCWNGEEAIYSIDGS